DFARRPALGRGKIHRNGSGEIPPGLFLRSVQNQRRLYVQLQVAGGPRLVQGLTQSRQHDFSHDPRRHPLGLHMQRPSSLPEGRQNALNSSIWIIRWQDSARRFEWIAAWHGARVQAESRDTPVRRTFAEPLESRIGTRTAI